MLYLLGLEENLKTIYMLSKPYADGDMNSEEQLKKSYLNFLSKIQPNTWHPKKEDGLFVFDKKIIETLIQNHEADDFLTDFKTNISLASDSSVKTALSKVDEAKKYINSKHEDLSTLFNLAINSIFYARSSEQGGGSVSSAIGAIWCCNRKSWGLEDTVEFIVHELTHNLIFLDELRYKHYISLPNLAGQENFVTSAILKIPRPLDKVFHSLLVATEILDHRYDWLGEPIKPIVHPSSEQIHSNCLLTLSEIKNLISKKELVTDRFKELLTLTEKRLLKISAHMTGASQNTELSPC
tara:strand:+ start:14772 stop:15659 length:888 start_codon:yes stop_codon:yes gene_type:complete